MYGTSTTLGYTALASWTLSEQTLFAAALNAAGVDFALGASLSMKPNCDMVLFKL
jgi:hypothetical protein